MRYTVNLNIVKPVSNWTVHVVNNVTFHIPVCENSEESRSHMFNLYPKLHHCFPSCVNKPWDDILPIPKLKERLSRDPILHILYTIELHIKLGRMDGNKWILFILKAHGLLKLNCMATIVANLPVIRFTLKENSGQFLR